MADLPHLSETGDARMVDVGDKDVTHRQAEAEAVVLMAEETRAALFSGSLPKGDALAVARIAGIMAAKRTPELIPLCHPLPLSAVEVTVDEFPEGARIAVRASTEARTGVEMEAMTGAAVAALAIYDMVKSQDRSAQLSAVRLLSKSGGRSGEWTR